MTLVGSNENLPRGKVLCRALGRAAEVVYYLYLPKVPAENAAVVVAVHGISRNADEHVAVLGPVAERHGAILVAPLFDPGRFPDYQRLGRKGRGERADLALAAILDEVAQATGAATDRACFYGHSGGGQFVHRFAMANPDRVARYAVSSAGWYTAPDPARAFPKGTRATRTLPGATFDVNRFLRIPACVLVGERDTDRDGSLNRSVRLDTTQGRTRIERAQWWVGQLTTAARWRGLDTPFSLHVLPKSGHEFTELASRGGLTDVLFRFFFA